MTNHAALSDADYRSVIMHVAMCAKLLADYDIPDLIRKINRAETVGPMLDPTLWIRKNKAMDEDKEMLKAALPLHQLGKKLAALAAVGKEKP